MYLIQKSMLHSLLLQLINLFLISLKEPGSDGTHFNPSTPEQSQADLCDLGASLVYIGGSKSGNIT